LIAATAVNAVTVNFAVDPSWGGGPIHSDRIVSLSSSNGTSEGQAYITFNGTTVVALTASKGFSATLHPTGFDVMTLFTGQITSILFQAVYLSVNGSPVTMSLHLLA